MPPPDLLPVFNAMPGAHLLLSPEWRIVAASDDYLAATLAERNIIVGQNLFEAFPDNPETPEANGGANIRASLETVLATKQPHEPPPQHHDVPDPHRPGYFVERHWKPRHTPVLDAAGQVQFVIQSVQDITESRLAEQRLRESRADEQAARAEADDQRRLLQEVFQQAPVAIALLDGPAYRITLANPTVCELWALPEPELLGRPLLDALPALEGQGVDTLLDGVLHTGQPFVGTELPFELERHGRRETIYFNFVYQPQRDAQGTTTGVLVVATDVTPVVLARHKTEAQERQTAELNAELLRSQAELSALNQELEARVQARTRDVLRAQAETDAQRQRLHRLVAEAPVLIASLRGPEHHVALANTGFRQLFGGRELVGKPYRQAVPELEGQPFFGLLDEVYRTGHTYHGLEEPVTLDRTNTGRLEHIYANYTFQATRDAKGQVEGVLIVATDVTEQVLARQERDAQRRQLEQLFMQAPAPIVILDGPDMVFELVNPAYQQLFPTRPLLGLPLLAALPELVDSPLPGIMAHVYRTGKTYTAQDMPLRLARTAGGPLEERYFTFIYHARRNAQDQIDGAVVFAHEVTEQVQARRYVEEAAAELRLLAAHAPAFLFRTDPAGQLTYLNDAFFEWTGFERAAFASLDEGWNALHPDDAAATYDSYAAGLRSGQPWESPLYRFRRRDGQYRWFISRTQPYHGPGGTVTGHSGITFEIHEQVELQRQLTRTNADLDNFIYTASHDLKAPIANIEGLLLALDHELPAAGRTGAVPEMLRLMQGAVERFTRTIEHLTDLTKLQKEHAPASAQVVLADVVEAVRLDLAPLLRQTRAQLAVDLPANLTLTFPEKNLRSIVYNLVSNALKYHHPNRRPEVHLRCRAQEGYHLLEVQDNGLGLDLARDEQKVFGMFQRLHSHVEGTGVGLYMVKKIVENAGGRIEVESQLGQGSTFTVYLPHQAMPPAR